MSLQEKIWENENLIKILQNGGVAVMSTDTIYGMVGKALEPAVVQRIYEIRNRDAKKPCIILIGEVSELAKFSITLSEEQEKVFGEYWPISALAEIGRPEPTSIILDCIDERFTYLHRGTKTLAFRIPAPQAFRDLLLRTGPLIAPSANTEKFPESENIEDARAYFGDKVDLYIDGGNIKSKASKIIKLHKDGSVGIIRE